MRRAVILGNNPYRTDYYKRDVKTVFEESGSNTGNQAITFGVACHMASDAAYLPWGTPVSQIRNAGDILVFPMANHLGKHTDLGRLGERLDEINLPVIGLGLGAQANSDKQDIQLTEGTTKWLETIIRHAPSDQPNLGLRGAYTAEQMNKLGFGGAGVVTGCPSNFINMSNDFVQKVKTGFTKRPTSIAVTAGIPFVPALANIEQDLIDIVTLTGGAYIVQHGINMVQIARNQFDEMAENVLENCRSYMMPTKSKEEFIRWCRQYAYAFFDAPAWMDFLRRFDFVVGTRFHGAMFAIQAGVPAACISHDSRTTEMCQTMGIPYCHYSDINGPLTHRNIMDYFTFDADRYIELRKTFQKNFLDIYKSADINYSPELNRQL
ncbi:MAG: polysaccharide pyruvyl transferase family protein [Janthinobacterium lividum]